MLDLELAALPRHTLLPLAERLRGRPKLCSDCGLCDTAFQPSMARACVFVDNQANMLEQRTHGRERATPDELLFGVYNAMYAARLKQPNPQAQWSGMVTRLGALLLERGIVDGVLTTGTTPEARFAPRPFLARTPHEVIASAGNKPCLSPGLSVLDEIRHGGVRRLATVVVGCQTHALRAIQAELGLEELYVVGIPCTDNVAYPELQRFLSMASVSPATVVHYEFMQDFRVHLRHEDGHIEKINFVDLPRIDPAEIFAPACMACFDYLNGLADLTIGYLGAPHGWQWVLERNQRGAALFNLLRPELEFSSLMSGGDRHGAVNGYVNTLTRPLAGRPPAPVRKLVAFMQRRRGPKGLEFARSIVEMKLLRNLVAVRRRYGRMERRVVPRHVYAALRRYAGAYRRAFETELDTAQR